MLCSDFLLKNYGSDSDQTNSVAILTESNKRYLHSIRYVVFAVSVLAIRYITFDLDDLGTLPKNVSFFSSQLEYIVKLKPKPGSKKLDEV